MKVKSDNTIYVKYWDNHGESFDASKIQIELGNPEFQWGKPDLGFWGSPINASYGWKEWCIDADFGDYDWNNPIYFRLKTNSTILKIDVGDLNDNVLGKLSTVPTGELIILSVCNIKHKEVCLNIPSECTKLVNIDFLIIKNIKELFTDGKSKLIIDLNKSSDISKKLKRHPQVRTLYMLN